MEGSSLHTTVTKQGGPKLTDALYGSVLGGPQSDRRLHGDAFELVRHLVADNHVLDTGVGRGGFTRKMGRLRPALLAPTDFDSSAVTSVTGKLRDEVGDSVKLLPMSLDLMGDLNGLEGRKFQLVVCISVLMHLPPNASSQAIRKLAAHVCDRQDSSLLVGVLSSAVARELYIPAPSQGPDCFYPLMVGLPAGSSENDVPHERRKLVEYYPRLDHYVEACRDLDGLSVTVHEAVAGDECNGSIYEPFKGKALWHLLKLTRC